MSVQGPANEQIFLAESVLGISPIGTPRGNLLLVLHRDSNDSTLLSVLSQNGNQWRESKRFVDPIQAQAMDVHLVKGEMFFAWEVNTQRPVEVSRCGLEKMLEPAEEELALTRVGKAALSMEQAQRVALPATHSWNVVTPLPPRQWLFSPRFVQGAPPETIIVNTADGQAMFVSAGSLSADARQFAHRSAFAPQAIAPTPADQILAFLRLEERIYPFWALGQYHDDEPPRPGALVVADRSGAEQNLSQLLGLGPVVGFQLLHHQGRDWLFAVKDAPVGSQVVALLKDVGGWQVRATLDVDQEVEKLAVLPDEQAWSLFLSVEEQNGFSIYQRRWKGD